MRFCTRSSRGATFSHISFYAMHVRLTFFQHNAACESPVAFPVELHFYSVCIRRAGRELQIYVKRKEHDALSHNSIRVTHMIPRVSREIKRNIALNAAAAVLHLCAFTALAWIEWCITSVGQEIIRLSEVILYNDKIKDWQKKWKAAAPAWEWFFLI